MSIRKLSVYIFIALFLSSCASYTAQYAKEDGSSNLELSQQLLTDKIEEKPTLSRTFYLIGDAGGSKKGEPAYALEAFKKVIDTADTRDDFAIFLGDNVYDKGLVAKDNPDRAQAEYKLDAQLQAVQNFKGNTLFIPGNHDWYDAGLKSVKRQEEYIEKALDDKNAFQPENGCPIEKIDVSEEIVLLVLDTQWYLSNWDKHPTINDECDIKTRDDFFLEIEGQLKKNNEKTIVIAMHHPMFTNGVHGGKYAARKHLFPFQSKIPLPGIASLITQLRSAGGVSPQDNSNKRYRELMGRLSTLAYDTNKAIFVSGHEHSLQYINHDGVKQIVSGSGSKKSAASLGDDGLFAFGGQGFAILDVYDDGSSKVKFYSAEKGIPSLLFEKEVHKAWSAYDTSTLSNSFETAQQATVYDQEATDKGEGYSKFWGTHYRSVYGTAVKVPVITLDTLMGGFSIDRKGGGHQTRSLRLVSPQGKNFALRAVKKSAVQFLQSVVFKESFIQEEFRDTFTEDVIQDFYTASHPFASLAVGDLAEAINVYHTNPQLVWMPKHPSLGKYNETYGDELYILEERPDEGFLDVASFGTPDEIESTADMLENIRDDEEYRIDQEAFVRARLFDMLLGDWDRHADQWRWARFDKNGIKTYKPIPRDRDQVFSNYDGRFLNFIKTFVPGARQFQEYDGILKDVKWINIAGSKLDHALLPNATKDIWIAQARFIQENLTDAAIEKAFDKFPKEVQTAQLDQIKAFLKERRGNLPDIAHRYYNHLNKLVILKGTDKDDHFEITREANGTRIQISRIKGGEIKKPFIDRLLLPKETKELWIYGLDDDDTFRVSGKGKKPIYTRIIGGQNNDEYIIEEGRKIKIYDHKTKPNTITKKGSAALKLSSIYEQNTYNINKIITRVNSILPSIGFNPDDGLIIGVQDTYIVKGFTNDPFYRKHQIRAGYYAATGGFDASYQGEFANSIGNWNLLIGGRFTSDSFALNFFGFGNDTPNNDDIEPLGLDFNRVRTGQKEVRLGLVRETEYGSRLELSANFQAIEIEDTQGRFITQDSALLDSSFFDTNSFVGVAASYSYRNLNNGANPSRGMLFDLTAGTTLNIESTERIFGFIRPSLTFYNALSRNKKWVLKTQAQGQFNIGDSFEFYQAATVGANNGLRGFRNQRFTGESALAGSADIRYSFPTTKTGVLPLQFGVFGGGDVGRVWVDFEDSDIWHTSLGGGFWVNAVDLIAGQFGLFNSADGLRFSFGFNVNL